MPAPLPNTHTHRLLVFCFPLLKTQSSISCQVIACEQKPLFMHGFSGPAFEAKYLAKRCGGTASNIPDATKEFVDEHTRIVEVDMAVSPALRAE